MGKYTLQELTDTRDPAWPLIERWISDAIRHVEILPGNRLLGEETLLTLQVGIRSILGAVAYETGGIAVDRGWLMFLGAGNQDFHESLLNWNSLNKSGESTEGETRQNAFIVAYDVVGGFFAINGGRFQGAKGNIFYFAPDSLEWEDLELSYSSLLSWAMKGDLGGFYSDLRWPGWDQEVKTLGRGQGFSFWPPLWSKGGSPLERSRRVITVRELWNLECEMAEKIKDLPSGTHIRMVVTEDPS